MDNKPLFRNIGKTTVGAGGITTTMQTAIPIAELGSFPSSAQLTAGTGTHIFMIIIDAATGLNKEIMKVTDVSASTGAGTATVVRGQQLIGTDVAPINKYTFIAGDRVELRTTAGSLEDMIGWIAELFDVYGDGAPVDVLRLERDRPQFEKNSNSIVDIIGGAHPHYGTKTQILKINGTINHTITSPGTSRFQYLYADDSAIVIAGTNILTGSEFYNAPGNPTYSITKNGWYNGVDLCIGAVLIDGSGNIVEFFHDGGDYINYAGGQSLGSGLTPSTTWTDVDASAFVPAFSSRISVNFDATYNNASATLRWRTNGQTDSDGHGVAHTPASPDRQINTVENVFTDSSGIFEIKFSQATTNEASLTINGWYFPKGM